MKKDACKNAKFQVIGSLGSTGNDSTLRSKIILAVKDDTIMYSGAVEDVRPHIAKADCVLLPFYYREGTPRSLLEAAAMEKPIITTDMSGYREVVEKGINGYLCSVRDPKDLAGKMIQFFGLPAGENERMGRYTLRKMEKQFDESIVNGRYLSAVKDSLGR